MVRAVPALNAEPPNRRGARILVVDDEPGIRELLALELSEHGYDVVQASDGAAALPLIACVDFDVVISDIRMPRLDGVGLLRATKSSLPSCEFIITTGYAELETAVACLRGGAFDLIEKPFRTDDVLAVVERALARADANHTARINRAAQALLSDGATGMDSLERRIVHTAAYLLDADGAALLLADSTGRLALAHAMGVSAQIPEVDHLLQTDRSGLDGASDLLPATNGSTVFQVLPRDGFVLGVLRVDRRDPSRRFRTSDRAVAAAFAYHAASALHAARLMQDLVAKERLASLGSVAAALVHEINNPLTVLSGCSQLAKRALSRLDSEGSLRAPTEVEMASLHDLLTGIERGVERIRDIGIDVRGMAYQGAARVDLDLRECVQGAQRLVAASAPEVVFDIVFPDPIAVHGHSGGLRQVFVNLFTNAVQAIRSAGRGAGTVSVAVALEDERAVVSVSDDGPGIAPEHLALVTRPFFTTKGHEQGTGLGLSITSDILRSHGGDLRMSSELGRGATFSVELPIAPEIGAAPRCRAG